MKTNKTYHIVILDFDDINNPLLGGGQARATVEVGKRLAEMGHRITVITSTYPGCHDRYEQGMHYKHIGLGTNNIRINNFLYIFALPFALRNVQADIVLECFTAPISTLFSPLWTKIPVIAIPSTFDATRFSQFYHLPFDVIEKFGVRFYKYFLPFSSAIDRQMKKLNPEIISKIVPEGVDKKYLSIKKQDGEYILYLGRLELFQKGIDLLLHAYKLIEKDIHFPLVIAGDGPDKKKVIELIKKLDLEEKVTLVGPKYGTDQYKVLSKALFYALPSRAETFSLSTLEALAAGLPIVAFDIPGISWTDKTVALKAKQNDIEAYAKLLKRAADKKLTTIMGEKARKFASKFTWDHVAREYDKFIRFVINKEKSALNNI